MIIILYEEKYKLASNSPRTFVTTNKMIILKIFFNQKKRLSIIQFLGIVAWYVSDVTAFLDLP